MLHKRNTIQRFTMRAALAAAAALAATVGLVAPAAGQMAAAAPVPVEDTTWPVPASAEAPGEVGTDMVGGTAPTQNYPGGAYTALFYDVPGVVTDWLTCGGAFVTVPGAVDNRRTVVTAAHCVTDMPAGLSADERDALAARYHLDEKTAATPVAQRQFHVRIGSQKLSEGGVTARVTVKWVHPGFNWATTPGDVDDIAILETDAPISGVEPLPLSLASAREGARVFGLGWGLTTPDASGDVPERVRELRSNVIADVFCTDAMTDPSANRDICAANVKGKEGVCYGDSGGPKVQKVAGRFVLVGVLSRMTSTVCGAGNAAYTDLPLYGGELADAIGRGPITTQGPGATRPTVQPLARAGR